MLDHRILHVGAVAMGVAAVILALVAAEPGVHTPLLFQNGSITTTVAACTLVFIAASARSAKSGLPDMPRVPPVPPQPQREQNVVAFQGETPEYVAELINAHGEQGWGLVWRQIVFSAPPESKASGLVMFRRIGGDPEPNDDDVNGGD